MGAESSSTITRNARIHDKPDGQGYFRAELAPAGRVTIVVGNGVFVFDAGWRWLEGATRGLVAAIVVSFAAVPAFSQVADFKIIWVNVGEVAASAERPARAGRQLFMAPDLVKFSLNDVTVARVEAEPSIVSLSIGERFCLTSLVVSAVTESGGAVDDAPLSVSVRQDHRQRLALQRSKKNICFRPSSSGEYPVRLNSLLPARDGTTRGAQIFLRVRDASSRAEPPPAAEATN